MAFLLCSGTLRPLTLEHAFVFSEGFFCSCPGCREASLPAKGRQGVAGPQSVRVPGLLLRLIVESSQDCPAAKRLFCVTRGGGPQGYSFLHPNPLSLLACSRDLPVDHCWAVSQLWPPCGVRMLVPPCPYLSQTVGCPFPPVAALLPVGPMLFLCLKMAATA